MAAAGDYSAGPEEVQGFAHEVSGDVNGEGVKKGCRNAQCCFKSPVSEFASHVRGVERAQELRVGAS